MTDTRPATGGILILLDELRSNAGAHRVPGETVDGGFDTLARPGTLAASASGNRDRDDATGLAVIAHSTSTLPI